MLQRRIIWHATYIAIALSIVLALVAGCSGPAAPAAKEPAKQAEQAQAPKPAAQTNAAKPAEKAEAPKAAATKPAAKAEAPKAAGGKEPYKLAWVGSLTGAFGKVGATIKKGVDVEIETVNKSGGIDGHPVELVAYDDQSKAEEAVLLFRKAVEQDKALAILGPLPSVQVIPVQPVARTLNTPWIFFGSVAPTPDDKYMFSNINTVEQLVETYIAYASKKGWKRIAGLHPTDDLSNRASAAIKSIGGKYGIEVVGEERYGLKDNDITPQVTKIKAMNPQAIIAWGTGDPAILAYRNAQQVGLNVPMFLNTSNANSTFFDLTGEIPRKGLLYTGGVKAMYADDLPNTDPAKAKAKDFSARFTAKFGVAPEANESWGADSADMILDALKKVGPDRTKIKDFLENMKYDGVAGTYVRTPQPQDHVGMDPASFVMVVAEGKKWVKAD
ncbi:MAG: ABC transporter substrate-binding protein [Chloroflexi bacterium]|nr:ABC transporter substrate-binding protein [Chloroflexota bacterium]